LFEVLDIEKTLGNLKKYDIYYDGDVT